MNLLKRYLSDREINIGMRMRTLISTPILDDHQFILFAKKLILEAQKLGLENLNTDTCLELQTALKNRQLKINLH